jgi:fatty acid desaturase
VTTPDEPRSDTAPQPTVTAEERALPEAKKRRRKRRLLELLLWTAVAVATAAFLVYASERWLPANF